VKTRRVVTGKDETGRSVVLSDDIAPLAHEFEALPGQGFVKLWRTEPGGTLESKSDEPQTLTGPLLPAPDGTSFTLVNVAPDAAALSPTFDPAAVGAEFGAYVPDFAATFEPEAPGMHTTDTVDYGIVLDGEVWLELDDGAETRLTRGDVVVQLGARHAWRNKTDRPATVAFVLVGARRA
jgi:Cupin domain